MKIYFLQVEDPWKVYPAKVAEESLRFTIYSATRSSKNCILLRFDKHKI